MGAILNTRILRFLVVLLAVLLTIFIYASYSTSTALTQTSHMRVASAYMGQQHQRSNHSRNSSNSNELNLAASSSNIITSSVDGQSIQQQIKQQQQQQHTHARYRLSSTANNDIINTNNNKNTIKKQHRIPTIDADALGGSGGSDITDANNNNLNDDINDEEHLVNNDLLEEQYAQNVDNIMGNVNNTGAVAVASQTQQQLQQQLILNNNNNNIINNKISDADVLIPTSNLQKFIENADKILKNVTGVSPIAASQTAANVNDQKTFGVPANGKLGDAPSAAQKTRSKDDAGVVDDEDNGADDEPLPPSVIMTIKNPAVPAVSHASGTGAGASPPVPPVVATKGSKESKSVSTKVSEVSKAVVHTQVDPTQGIPTERIYEGGHLNDEINIERLCPNFGSDVKLLILITSAPSHAEARLAIRQTWGHYGTRRDVSTAFMLGRTTNETIGLSLTQENFIYGDLIRGNFIDSYNNLTLKTISSMEWVDQHCSKAKFILKTDDDMFINVPKLLTFLDSHKQNKRVIYGRLAKKWKPIRNKKSKYYVSIDQFAATTFPYFTTGPAYVMTSDVVHDLYEHSLHTVYLKLEDVFTTGIVAQQLGIKRVHVNEFLNRRISFNPCNIRNTISVHMIKSNEQFDLWKKLLDQSTKCK